MKKNKLFTIFDDYLYNIWHLTKRNILIFFQNKTTLIFSMMAPILILVIYILFMGDFQVNTIKGFIPEGIAISDQDVVTVANAWMISGILGISSLTISLNSMFVAISDRERGIVDDFTASPVKLVNLTLSYFISAFIITFFLSFIFLVIALIFLRISSGYNFTFANLVELLSILLLSSLSAVIFVMCLTSFFNHTSTAASFTGVFSALIGFLIGAYLPSSILPIPLQNFANLIPGSHATGLFRVVLMRPIFEQLEGAVPIEVINQIKNSYGFNLNLFGAVVDRTYMYLYLGLSVLVLFVIFQIISMIKRKLRA
ncbi:MAG: ABC transporter permease [Bacilli bacterium]|jgi:multidrug/hemolysin transport system permease protein